MKKIIVSIVFFSILLSHAYSFKVTENTEFSLITCSPGRELYSQFGHSALRMTDTTNNIDLIFNWGTFDFRTEHFYWKFIRGHLQYMLSISTYDHFIQEYFLDGRSVDEQILNLSFREKQILAQKLQLNYTEENRYYRYDFLFDNCATRIRDIVEESVQGDVVFKYENLPEEISYINLLRTYIEPIKWIEFGIGILMGYPGHKIASGYDYMYLPDFLMAVFGQSAIKEVTGSIQPLVKESNSILKRTTFWESGRIFTPINVFTLLLLITFLLSYYDYKNKRITYLYDRILFFIPGLLGVLFMFLWIFSGHDSLQANMNIIWAFPAHLVIVFFVRKQWVKKYFTINTAILLLFLILFSALPQEFESATLLIVASLFLRSAVYAYNGYFVKNK